MNARPCSIILSKEAFKFSSAHMTVFPDGSKEALHGHNYQVEVEIQLLDTSLNQLISFSVFKEQIKQICQQWDEKILIAEKCPFFQVRSQSAAEFEFILCQKRYLLPADEVVLLPLDNVTTETLAHEFCDRLVQVFESNRLFAGVSGLKVRIDESRGQGASVSWAHSSRSSRG
ncbi:MAG: 6-pyruvoyl trahydropterin synthase family protein [Bdellovibrionia bacterium]